MEIVGATLGYVAKADPSTVPKSTGRRILRAVRRVLIVIRASKEADRAKLAEDFLHIVAA